MDDTLVVVHCYEGDKDQVDTFLPFWLHHGAPVLLLSPADSKVKVEHPGVKYASAGKRGWKGQQTLARQLRHWKLALKEPQNWIFLNDADSMCITPELPDYLYSDPNKFWCNVLCHENEHLESDKPNLNPPYFMHRDVLKALVKAADAIQIPEEANMEPHDWGQAIDGFYSHLVMNVLNIPYEDFPDGSTTWPRGTYDMMEQARTRGARIFHGIKTMSQLGMIHLNYNNWEMEQDTLARLAAESAPLNIGDTIRI